MKKNFRTQNQETGFGSSKPKMRGQHRPVKKNHESKERVAVKPNSNSSLVFGLLPVLETLKAGGRRIEKILIAEGIREKRLQEVLDLIHENHVPFQKVPRQNLTKFVEADANHQGIIAFVAAADYYETDQLLNEISLKIEKGGNPLLVILDGIEDPRNFGAILRTCETAGVDGVFIPERRAVGLR